jgi:hypothetical protein
MRVLIAHIEAVRPALLGHQQLRDAPRDEERKISPLSFFGFGAMYLRKINI